MKKSKRETEKYIDENLIRVFENPTPYERLVWLKKAFNFWKMVSKRKKY